MTPDAVLEHARALEVRGTPVEPGIDVSEGDADWDVPSVLYSSPRPARQSTAEERGLPSYFADLHLDNVLAALDAHSGVGLARPFSVRLSSPAEVVYRLDVFVDLERISGLADGLQRFVDGMRRVRSYATTGRKRSSRLEAQLWTLAAFQLYIEVAGDLQACLASADVTSSALRAVREHLEAYRRSPPFTALVEEAAAVGARLDGIRYAVRVRGSRVTVTLDEVADDDFSAHVDRTFERLVQDEAGSRLVAYAPSYGLNHVEAAILERVARLCPAEFAALDDVTTGHARFVEPMLARLETEVPFYLAYLAVMAQAQERGATFTHPRMIEDLSTEDRDESAADMVDLALALASGNRQPLVANDFELAGPERTLLVTGPNQGGKTTFARAVGQLYHLAAVGCPVPAGEATLALVDDIYTHFERAEDRDDTGGKLEDDLRRIHDVLEHASSRSLVVINEMFTSTTLSDAGFLGTEIVQRLSRIGARTIFVTFVDALAGLGPSTVSMVSLTAADDPTRRTFRVVRHPPVAEIYAMALARRHGLTRTLISDQVRERSASPTTRADPAGPARGDRS